MFALALARPVSQAGVHSGWVLVAIVFLLALAAARRMGMAGAPIVPLPGEFGGFRGRSRLVWARA